MDPNVAQEAVSPGPTTEKLPVCARQLEPFFVAQDNTAGIRLARNRISIRHIAPKIEGKLFTIVDPSTGMHSVVEARGARAWASTLVVGLKQANGSLQFVLFLCPGLARGSARSLRHPCTHGARAKREGEGNQLKVTLSLVACFIVFCACLVARALHLMFALLDKH